MMCAQKGDMTVAYEHGLHSTSTLADSDTNQSLILTFLFDVDTHEEEEEKDLDKVRRATEEYMLSL